MLVELFLKRRRAFTVAYLPKGGFPFQNFFLSPVPWSSDESLCQTMRAYASSWIRTMRALLSISKDISHFYVEEQPAGSVQIRE